MSKQISDKQRDVLQRAGFTAEDLSGLTTGQATALLHYVVRNNWKRPTATQIEAIAAEEMNEDEAVLRSSEPMARIPSDNEVEELAEGMSPGQMQQFYDAMDDLKEAVHKGREAFLQQGRALCLLKKACGHKAWGKVLQTLDLPRTTAHRQMQVARAHAAADSDLREMLEKRGIRFNSRMSARDVKIVQGAAEIAKKTKSAAEADYSHLFHSGTNKLPPDGPFAGLPESFEHDRHVAATVEQAVGDYLDGELKPKSLPDRKQISANFQSHSPKIDSSAEELAESIATIVIQRLQAVDARNREQVWKLVVEKIDDGDLFMEKQEVTNVAAA